MTCDDKEVSSLTGKISNWCIYNYFVKTRKCLHSLVKYLTGVITLSRQGALRQGPDDQWWLYNGSLLWLNEVHSFTYSLRYEKTDTTSSGQAYDRIRHVLALSNSDVATYGGLNNFDATFVLVVTWDGIVPRKSYDAYYDRSYRATRITYYIKLVKTSTPPYKTFCCSVLNLKCLLQCWVVMFLSYARWRHFQNIPMTCNLPNQSNVCRIRL